MSKTKFEYFSLDKSLEIPIARGNLNIHYVFLSRYINPVIEVILKRGQIGESIFLCDIVTLAAIALIINPIIYIDFI